MKNQTVYITLITFVYNPVESITPRPFTEDSNFFTNFIAKKEKST